MKGKKKKSKWGK